MVMQLRLPERCRDLVRGSWDGYYGDRYTAPLELPAVPLTKGEKEEDETPETVVVVESIPERVDVGAETDDYIQL